MKVFARTMGAVFFLATANTAGLAEAPGNTVPVSADSYCGLIISPGGEAAFFTFSVARSQDALAPVAACFRRDLS